MLRNVLATIFGLFIGMCVNMALIQLNTTVFYPMPVGLDMNDPAQFNDYLESLPSPAFIVVMLAHLGQALVGGWTAARLGHSRPKLLAMIVGVFSLVGGIAAMMMFKGPPWMAVELPLYLVLAWVAGSFEAKRRGALTTTEHAPSA